MRTYVYALTDNQRFSSSVIEKLNDVVAEGIASYLRNNYSNVDKSFIKGEVEIQILINNVEDIANNVLEITNNKMVGDMVFMVNFASNRIQAYAIMDQVALRLKERDVMYFCLDDEVKMIETTNVMVYTIPEEDFMMESLIDHTMTENGWSFKTEITDETDAVKEPEEVGQKKSATKMKQALVMVNTNLSTSSVEEHKEIYSMISSYFDEVICIRYNITKYSNLDYINQFDSIFIIEPGDDIIGRISYVTNLTGLLSDINRFKNFSESINEKQTFIIELPVKTLDESLVGYTSNFKALVKWKDPDDRKKLEDYLSGKVKICNSNSSIKEEAEKSKPDNKKPKFVILIGEDSLSDTDSYYTDWLEESRYCNSYTTMDVVSSKDNVTDILFTDKLKDMGLPVVIDVNSIVDSSEKGGIDGLKVLISVFDRLSNLDIKTYVVAGLSKSISVGLIPLTVLIDISKMNNVLIKDDDITEIDRFFECVANRKDYDRPIL